MNSIACSILANLNITDAEVVQPDQLLRQGLQIIVIDIS